MEPAPTLRDVYHAHKRIFPIIHRTQLQAATELAQKVGASSVHFKLECLQKTGSFKIRGAANKILSLDTEAKKQGVITFSTGNHGKAVAYVAGQVGVPALVCLSNHVAPYRAETIRQLGAEVAIQGDSQDEAEKNYNALIESRKLIPVVPFDDPLIIAGQATLTLEILSELPDSDIMLIQLSGGGLLAGMALAAKSINPNIRMVGVSIERSPAMLESVKAGKPVQVEEKDSIADSLLGGIGLENHYTLPLIQKFTDDHLLVTEEEIKAAIYYIFEKHRLIVEGAAAVGVAALLSEKMDVNSKKVVALLSGGSIESNQYLDIIKRQAALH